MKIKLFFIIILLASPLAYSQDKCSDLFFNVNQLQAPAEAIIRDRLNALVIQKFKIDYKKFDTSSQLQQAKEMLDKELKNLIRIDPKYLIEFKNLLKQNIDQLQNQEARQSQKKLEEEKNKEEKIKAYEIFDVAEVKSIEHNHYVRATRFSRDSKHVVTIANSTVRYLEAATGRETSSVQHQTYGSRNDAIPTSISPDGKFFVMTSFTGNVTLHDIGGIEPVLSLSYPSKTNSTHFSSDGKYLATSTVDGTVIVTEIATKNSVTFTIDPRPHDILSSRDIYSSNFSPDGKYIVAATFDGIVKVIELATGHEVLSFRHARKVNSAFFSFDGKYILTASMDNTAKIIEFPSGKEISTITHAHRVNSANFSPDAKYVVTASSDKTFKLFDVTTGKEILSQTELKKIKTAEFSPDGKYLVATLEDTTVKIYKLFNNSLVK